MVSIAAIKLPLRGMRSRTKDAIHNKHIVQQSNDCHGTGGPAANAAETHGNVHQNQHAGSHNSHNALGQELVADGGVDVADFLLDKLVVRVGGVQGFDHAVQLLG